MSYDPAPPVLAIGSGPAAAARAAALAEAAGFRVVDRVAVANAPARLDQQAALAAVLLEIDDDDGPALDALLARLDAGVAAGRYGGVVVAPPALLDAVAAAAPNLLHLCEPRPGDRERALRRAGADRLARLHDVGAEARESRLRELSDEVGRIAQVLARLSARDAPAAAPEESGEPEAEITVAEVRAMIRARRLRDQFFEPELFADPAWDMLLDLFAARLDYKLVAVSSLCIAAAVPPTTALRWIKTMTDAGLFVRRADPQDGRRVFIELSDGAAAAMTGYVVQLRRLSSLAV